MNFSSTKPVHLLYFDSKIQRLGSHLARYGTDLVFFQLLSGDLALKPNPQGLLFMYTCVLIKPFLITAIKCCMGLPEE